MKRLPRSAATLAAAALVAAAPIMAPAAADAAGRPARPTDLRIATLPAVAGYPMTFEGIRALTDRHGVAHFPIDAATVHGLGDLKPAAAAYLTVGGTRVRVQYARTYDVSGRHRVVLLNLYYLTRFTFRNSNSGALDASVIHTVTVKSSIGSLAVLPAHRPVWLQGSRVVPLAGGLEVKKLYWTVQDVQYAGTNVVNSSQQRFMPADTQTKSVTLLFYSARLRVHDAFFALRRGGTAVLVYPDTTRRTLHLDNAGSVFLPSLPRGNYSLVLRGLGPSMTQQISISTNQDLDLKYYSWIDIAFVLFLALFFTAGLLAIGIHRRRRARPTPDGDGDGDSPRRRDPQRAHRLVDHRRDVDVPAGTST